jgi:hypothetical protein
MKLHYCLFLLIFCKYAAQKPNLTWAVNHGTKILSQTTTLDKQGNIYAGGFGADTVDFDPGPVNNPLIFTQNTFLAKYRPNGSLLWAKALGVNFVPVPFEICVDGQQNVYVCGTFYGTYDFDPGPAVFTLTARNADIAIIKFDSLGNFLWAGNIGSTEFDQASEMKVDGQDNLYLSGWGGESMFPVDLDLDPGPNVSGDTIERYSDGFMVKLSPNGTFQWGKTWGSWAYEYVSGFDIDPAGNLVITGHGIAGMDLDPGPQTLPGPGSPGMSWTFVMSMNTAGNILWSRFWEAGEYSKVEFDNSGNVVLLASFYGSVDLNPGPATQSVTSWKWLDAYVVKMNSSGNFIWARSWHDSGYIYIGRLHIDKQDNIFLTAMNGSMVDLDPGTGVDTVSKMGSFILKFDKNGAYKWSASFLMGTTISRPSVVTNASGDIYAAVWYHDVVDLDPGSGTSLNGSPGMHSSALIKLNDKPLNTGLANNIPVITEGRLVPNPAVSQFYLFEKDCGARGHFVLRDIEGKIVMTTPENNICEPIPINLPPGIYFCTWSGNLQTYKLIVEH